jgi:hypothetical protein
MKTLRLRFCPDMGEGAQGIRMRRAPPTGTPAIFLNLKPVAAVK